MIAHISAAELAVWIEDADELAIIDSREAGIYGEGHLFLAVNAPFSRLEAELPRLVPRRDTRLVLIAEPGLQQAVHARAQALGYTELRLLDGGSAAWEALGYALFKGVNLPSKTFAELVEHAFHTPALEPDEFLALRASGRRVVVLDPRTRAEYDAFHVPGAVSAPGAEIVQRFDDLVPDADTLVVVSCAGRTRGIVGAQALINAGVGGSVHALAGGTQAWRLAGHDLDRDTRARDYTASEWAGLRAAERAEKLARDYGIARIGPADLAEWRADPERTTYVFDVRQPEERGTPVSGLIAAEGGQLVQALDAWVGTWKARLILVDSAPGLRAVVTAHWLAQQGWQVAVHIGTPPPFKVKAPTVGTTAVPLTLAAFRDRISDGATLLFAGSSANWQGGHPAGAIWVNRSRPSGIPAAGNGGVVVLGDAPERDLLAADLARAGVDAAVFSGDWREAGLQVETEPLPEATRIDHLFWLHDRHSGNLAASRAYLDWELALPEAVKAAGPVFLRPGPPSPQQ
ncbi:rhodanese-like domain-containing protein [Paenirhodobacter populi]|nr:rhodanese-like domain-containing protein [Sinirhodobacter populi]